MKRSILILAIAACALLAALVALDVIDFESDQLDQWVPILSVAIAVGLIGALSADATAADPDVGATGRAAAVRKINEGRVDPADLPSKPGSLLRQQPTVSAPPVAETAPPSDASDTRSADAIPEVDIVAEAEAIVEAAALDNGAVDADQTSATLDDTATPGNGSPDDDLESEEPANIEEPAEIEETAELEEPAKIEETAELEEPAVEAVAALDQDTPADDLDPVADAAAVLEGDAADAEMQPTELVAAQSTADAEIEAVATSDESSADTVDAELQSLIDEDQMHEITALVDAAEVGPDDAVAETEPVANDIVAGAASTEPLARLELRLADYDDAALQRVVKESEAVVIAEMVRTGQLTSEGSLTEKDIASMVFLAYTSEEMLTELRLRKSLDQPGLEATTGSDLAPLKNIE